MATASDAPLGNDGTLSLTRLCRGRLTLSPGARQGGQLFVAGSGAGWLALDDHPPADGPEIPVPVTKKRRITLPAEFRRRARLRDGAQLVVLARAVDGHQRFTLFATYALSSLHWQVWRYRNWPVPD